MFMNQQERDKFEKIARPLIKFLNNNFHPHVTVIVTNTSAEITEGIISFVTDEYLKD